MHDKKPGSNGVTRRSVLAAVPAVALSTTLAARAEASSTSEITRMTATQLASAIHKRDLSSRDVLQAALARIDRDNPRFNAIVSRVPTEQLMASAAKLDDDAAAGKFHGPLHGFPHAVKDTANARGIITTQGSPIFRTYVAEQDSLHIARIRAAGAIFVGKTNVPEFALGSHSFNTVFGTTKNAYAPDRTAGGSTGGGAVALARRMVPLADGSDFGGSLRNPAGWNNLFGLRPSFGRVPSSSASDAFFQQFATAGAMARTARDVGLLLSVEAGYDARAPLSIDENPAVFAQPLDRDFKGKRIGWLGDFNGQLATEPGVLDTCRKALDGFRAIGMTVEEVHFPIPTEDMWRTTMTIRHWSVGGDLLPLYTDPAKRALLKPEAIWEVEGGLKLTSQDIMEATVARTRIYQAFRTLFETYDFLVLPSAQVFPFDATLRWPKAINGRAMDSYHRWMEITLPATMSGCPTLVVPAGFGGAHALPIGLQVIGPNRADLAVLQVGHAYEMASPWIATSLPAGV